MTDKDEFAARSQLKWTRDVWSPIRCLKPQNQLLRPARTGETDNRKTPKDVARDPGVSRTSQYSEHDALYRLDAEAV